MASITDPLLRHWFRCGGGDPNDLANPWGDLVGWLTGQSPTFVRTDHFALANGQHIYMAEFEGVNEEDADEQAGIFKKAIENAGGWTIHEATKHKVFDVSAIESD